MKGKRKKLVRGGIAEQWIYVTLLPSLVAVVIAFLSILFISRQNYYYSAEQAIGFRITSTLNHLPPSSQSAREKYLQLVDLVESFSEREKFEFMILDRSGNVLVTSGGFAYALSDAENDFMEAGKTVEGRASFIGNGARKEHIIAVTQILPEACGDAVAIRFVSSLRGIDRQLGSILRLSAVIGLLLIAIITVTGSFFIRSMTEPLGKIGATAKQIAAGGLDVRVDDSHSGEIGELCGIINDMAAELESSNNLKNDFISSISHEIRTPLTAIKGWSETLATLGPEEDALRSKGLEIIVSEADRLQLLVEDLLDFSKLEAKRTLSLASVPLDLREELDDLVLTLEQRARQLGISVDYRPAEGPVPIFADKNKMRQVFTNIFDNAVKYSPRRSTIHVTLTADAAEAHVSIRDEGPGIPADEIDKVTTKYFRASNSVYGTGIGLALVSEILKAHKGRLDIESELGHGANMIVSVPLNTEQ